MSALVTSDLHLTANPRDAYRHDFMRTLPDLIFKHKVSGLIINGDLTEEKDRHPAWLVNAIVGYIADCAELVPVFVNKGNHDYTDIDNPFFKFLSRIQNVTWIDKPTPNADGRGIVDLNIGTVYFFPHTTDWKRDWKDHLKTACKQDWVFAHQTFVDTIMQSGHTAGTIPRDVFGDATVLCGDVHIPRTLTGTIEYIGAPYTIDFGDDYQGRTMIVDAKGYKSIPYRGRQKRFVELSANSNDKLVLKNMMKFTIGDIVKVRVKLTSGNRHVWPDVRRMVQEWADELGYELHSVVPMIEKTHIKATTKTYSKKSDDELLTTYAKNRGLDGPTLKLGQILMRKV